MIESDSKCSLPIILASSSKWRAQILSNAGFNFITMSPNINESAFGGSRTQNCKPSETALAIAHAKCDAISSTLSTSAQKYLVICSDQVVAFSGSVREKPGSAAEAREFLASYRAETPAETHTAVVLLNTLTRKRVSGVDVAKQYFDNIPPGIIDQLIEQGDVMNCAGGFLIDDPIIGPFLGRRVGSEDSVIGMPLELTRRLLREVQET